MCCRSPLRLGGPQDFRYLHVPSDRKQSGSVCPAEPRGGCETDRGPGTVLGPEGGASDLEGEAVAHYRANPLGATTVVGTQPHVRDPRRCLRRVSPPVTSGGVKESRKTVERADARGGDRIRSRPNCRGRFRCLTAAVHQKNQPGPSHGGEERAWSERLGLVGRRPTDHEGNLCPRPAAASEPLNIRQFTIRLPSCLTPRNALKPSRPVSGISWE
jgi:hypothetical protein